MQRLLIAATEWADEYSITWSAKDCATIRKEEYMEATPLVIHGQKIGNRTQADYLRTMERQVEPKVTEP